MFEFWFQNPSKTCTTPKTSPVFTVLLLEPFGTTGVYEHGFSYVSISIFIIYYGLWYDVCSVFKKCQLDPKAQIQQLEQKSYFPRAFTT